MQLALLKVSLNFVNISIILDETTSELKANFIHMNTSNIAEQKYIQTTKDVCLKIAKT